MYIARLSNGMVNLRPDLATEKFTTKSIDENKTSPMRFTMIYIAKRRSANGLVRLGA